MDAYLSRKKWEFRAQAVAVANVLGEMMNGTPKDGQYTSGHREVSEDEMLTRIGMN